METLKPDQAKIPRVEVIGITGIPEISSGDHLGEIIVGAAENQDTPIEASDVLIVTQKIVSKAEGRVADLREVEPSAFAYRIAQVSNRDPRLIELVMRESRTIVRMDLHRGIIITETEHGFVCANAGIDSSNVPGDHFVTLLPKDPDRSAQRIQEDVRALTNTTVAVVLSDTFGRAWREGQVNFAIGVAGMCPVTDYRGTADATGRIMNVTTVAVADELASAAELVTAKTSQVPVAIVRGYRISDGPDGIQALIREPSRDLFR